jgi:23S rRNA (pseudouridine1915-N3)-methyltransferase
VKLTIAWIGKTKESAIQTLTDEYLKRISRYADSDGIVLKDESALVKICSQKSGPRPTLILLDEKGKQLSSGELAQLIREHQNQSSSTLLFAVGSADGFTDETRQRARMLLSLGRMTLAHELARVVLLEQLYRAFTILQGHPYHLGH